MGRGVALGCPGRLELQRVWLWGLEGSAAPCLPSCLISEPLVQMGNLGVPLAVEAVLGGGEPEHRFVSSSR